jgi:hypothetical protein
VLTRQNQISIFAEESPFSRVATVTIFIKCTFDYFGLMFEEDPMYNHNIIADAKHLSSASQVDWQCLLQLHTVIQVDTALVFSATEFLAQLRKRGIALQRSVLLIVIPYRPYPNDQHTIIQVDTALVFSATEVLAQFRKRDIALQRSVSLIVIPYRPYPNDQQVPLPQVALDQLRIVHHVLHGWDLSDPVLIITANNATNMAASKKHTRHTCLMGPAKDKMVCGETPLLAETCHPTLKVYDHFGIIVKRAWGNTQRNIAWMASSSFAWEPQSETPIQPARNSTASGCVSR